MEKLNGISIGKLNVKFKFSIINEMFTEMTRRHDDVDVVHF